MVKVNSATSSAKNAIHARFDWNTYPERLIPANVRVTPTCEVECPQCLSNTRCAVLAKRPGCAVCGLRLLPRDRVAAFRALVALTPEPRAFQEFFSGVVVNVDTLWLHRFVSAAQEVIDK